LEHQSGTPHRVPPRRVRSRDRPVQRDEQGRRSTVPARREPDVQPVVRIDDLSPASTLRTGRDPRIVLMRRAPVFAVAIGIALATGAGLLPQANAKPMSVHNRLLLNRAAISNQRMIELMMVVEPSQFDRIGALAIERGGSVRRSERAIGYLRVEVPIEQ